LVNTDNSGANVPLDHWQGNHKVAEKDFPEFSRAINLLFNKKYP